MLVRFVHMASMNHFSLILKGNLLQSMLSSVGSRFQSGCQQWIKMSTGEQMRRYHCFQHYLRLILSLSLNASSRRFGALDPFRTSRILPKEMREHRKRSKNKQMTATVNENKLAKNIQDFKLNSNHINNNAGPFCRTKQSSQGSTNLSIGPSGSNNSNIRSSSRGERLSSTATSNTPNTPRSRIQQNKDMRIINDQEILYLLKVLLFALPHGYGNEGTQNSPEEDPRRKLMDSVYRSKRTRQNVAGDTYSDHHKLKGRSEFAMKPKDILAVHSERMQQLAESLDIFGDDNHISNGIRGTKDLIKLESYGKAWCSILPGLLQIMNKIATVLSHLKEQDEKIAATANQGQVLKLDYKCKRARKDLCGQICFIYDTIGFLQIVQKVHQSIEPSHVEQIVMKYVATSDTLKRRKIFTGWEKEKLNCDAKRLKKMEERLAKKIKGGAAKLLF